MYIKDNKNYNDIMSNDLNNKIKNVCNEIYDISNGYYNKSKDEDEDEDEDKDEYEDEDEDED